MNPNRPVYLDSSAIVRWAEAGGTNPSARSLQTGLSVVAACSDASRLIALSPLGLIEFHNSLASIWRNSDPPYQQYDGSWVKSSQTTVMGMIASGRLTVRRVPPRAAEHAMALVTLATREHNNGLKAWDAIHLIAAADWAHELGSAVEIWTTDTDFGRFIELFPHFKRFVTVRNLDD